MDNNLKIQLAVAVALLGIGYAAGRYVQPAKVVTKTETIVKTNDVVHENVHTVIKEVTKPDGTKETVTEIDNKTVEEKSSVSDAKASTVTTYTKPQWKIQGMAGAQISQLPNLAPVYGVGVERRILGPVFVGAYGKTNSEVGISLSLEL